MINGDGIMTRHMAGFTMIEAVIVLVITGILSAMVAVFIKAPVMGYFDSVRRAEMTDAADTALKRIARDVRTALPNSLRATSTASTQCFEFLPTVGGGRYQSQLSSTGTGDPLLFSQADGSFDVLASDNLTATTFSGSAIHHAVIYNLGINGADAYDSTNLNRAQITNTSTPSHIDLNTPNQFPFESPGKRFYVIPDNSVAYSCSGGNLIRSTQPISATALAACPSSGAILMSNVDCAATVFNYVPTVTQRNALLTMRLVLTNANESVRLYDEVHVNNAP